MPLKYNKINKVLKAKKEKYQRLLMWIKLQFITNYIQIKKKVGYYIYLVPVA